jgi:HNH endonuclease
VRVQYLWPILAVLIVIALVIQYWYVAVIIAAAWCAPQFIRYIRMKRYFASDEFLGHKAGIAAVVHEHNEIATYTSEIRANGSFQLGASKTGAQAHLATFENTSRHAYRRDRNVADYAAANVHNCSLQVARNASSDPLKYLIKYFNIKATEDTMEDLEGVGESVSRLEGAVANLGRREDEISRAVNPPAFILKHYPDEFMKQVGVHLTPITVPYPEFRFEYVSAAGNSSQRTLITLNTSTIDALIALLSVKIRFAKSAAGQRALMTAKLRGFIKEHDHHTCQQCSASIAVEPNLLLEVDHVIPVSRGGLSVIENLQTLCWRCNRTKSNRLPVD